MENNRNWLELPSDVMLTILMKLQQQEILESAQFVCKMWYDICKDPSMWRSIRFKDLSDPIFRFLWKISKEPKSVLSRGSPAMFDHEKMVYNAVDRSAGGLIELDIQGFMPYDFWSYVASRSTQLKRLRISYLGIRDPKTMIEALQKLTCLEELQIYDPWYILTENMVSVVHACPSVTTLILNKGGINCQPSSCDEVAMAIAKTMPKLRHLELIRNNLTNVGLTSILEGCSRLQSLDLRECFHLRLEADLLNRLQKQIKYLRCPEDPTEDDDYPVIDYDSDDSDAIIFCNSYVMSRFL